QNSCTGHFRPSLDCIQPHPANQRAAGIDYPPIKTKPPASRYIGCINSRFSGNDACVRTGIFDEKVHRGESKSGFMDGLELGWGRLSTWAPSVGHDDSLTHDNFMAGLFRQQEKRGLGSNIEQRLTFGSI